MIKYIAQTLFLALILVSNAQAAVYSIENERSSMAFYLEHVIGFNAASVDGLSGEMEIKLKDAKLESFQVSVDLSTIETGDKLRNTLLKSDKFFNTSASPIAIIKSTSIKDGVAKCDLTYAGSTKTISLNVKVKGIRNTQDNKTVAVIKLTGEVNREDFGVMHNVKSDDGQDMLGKNIQIYADLEGVLQL